MEIYLFKSFNSLFTKKKKAKWTISTYKLKYFVEKFDRVEYKKLGSVSCPTYAYKLSPKEIRITNDSTPVYKGIIDDEGNCNIEIDSESEIGSLRNYQSSDKYEAICYNDYDINVFKKESHNKIVGPSSGLSLARNIDNRGDNMGNMLTICEEKVYFISPEYKLKMATIQDDIINEAIETIEDDIRDVISIGKAVYYISKSGLVKVIHKKRSLKALQLPYGQDEVTCILKQGQDGRIIAISMKGVDTRWFVSVYLISSEFRMRDKVEVPTSDNDNHPRQVFTFQIKSKKLDLVLIIFRNEFVSILAYNNSKLMMMVENNSIGLGSHYNFGGLHAKNDRFHVYGNTIDYQEGTIIFKQ